MADLGVSSGFTIVPGVDRAVVEEIFESEFEDPACSLAGNAVFSLGAAEITSGGFATVVPAL